MRTRCTCSDSHAPARRGSESAPHCHRTWRQSPQRSRAQKSDRNSPSQLAGAPKNASRKGHRCALPECTGPLHQAGGAQSGHGNHGRSCMDAQPVERRSWMPMEVRIGQKQTRQRASEQESKQANKPVIGDMPQASHENPACTATHSCPSLRRLASHPTCRSKMPMRTEVYRIFCEPESPSSIHRPQRIQRAAGSFAGPIPRRSRPVCFSWDVNLDDVIVAWALRA